MLEIVHPASWAVARIAGMSWVAINRRRGIEFGDGVRVIGTPRVRLVRGATVRIGHSVTLNSWSRGYHAAMHSPTLLIADLPGAQIAIGAESRINGATIHAKGRIVIGRRVLIAAQATLMDSNGHEPWPASTRLNSRDKAAPIVVEDDVWIGLGAVVLPGTRIGRGSIIGANAVARGDIPANSRII